MLARLFHVRSLPKADIDEVENAAESFCSSFFGITAGYFPFECHEDSSKGFTGLDLLRIPCAVICGCHDLVFLATDSLGPRKHSLFSQNYYILAYERCSLANQIPFNLRDRLVQLFQKVSLPGRDGKTLIETDPWQTRKIRIARGRSPVANHHTGNRTSKLSSLRCCQAR